MHCSGDQHDPITKQWQTTCQGYNGQSRTSSFMADTPGWLKSGMLGPALAGTFFRNELYVHKQIREFSKHLYTSSLSCCKISGLICLYNKYKNRSSKLGHKQTRSCWEVYIALQLPSFTQVLQVNISQIYCSRRHKWFFVPWTEKSVKLFVMSRWLVKNLKIALNNRTNCLTLVTEKAANRNLEFKMLGIGNNKTVQEETCC